VVTIPFEKRIINVTEISDMIE
jgi:hypothetical protein